MDATAILGSCDPDVLNNAKVTSLLQWAQDEGKLTGEYFLFKKRVELDFFALSLFQNKCQLVEVAYVDIKAD